MRRLSSPQCFVNGTSGRLANSSTTLITTTHLFCPFTLIEVSSTWITGFASSASMVAFSQRCLLWPEQIERTFTPGAGFADRTRLALGIRVLDRFLVGYELPAARAAAERSSILDCAMFESTVPDSSTGDSFMELIKLPRLASSTRVWAVREKCFSVSAQARSASRASTACRMSMCSTSSCLSPRLWYIDARRYRSTRSTRLDLTRSNHAEPQALTIAV